MLDLQDDEGYWWAELESNVTMASEHLLLEHFLGVGDQERRRKLARYILALQQPDGSWPVYFGGPGDVSITSEAYFALKLAGEDPESGPMQRAQVWVRDHGGVGKARVFTKLWLALFGQFDWDGLPAMPPEVIFFPDRFPFNIYAFASWARATIVPILVLWHYRPVVPIPDHARIDELYLDPDDRRRIRFARDRSPFTWRNFFLGADALLRQIERLPGRGRLRERALAACERWIVAHQEADGSWGGIQPPWVYSLMALKCRGYAVDHPVIARGLHGLWHEFGLERGETFTVQPCLSPIWDTALAVTGLREAGLPAGHPSLLRAGRWLLAREIRAQGDWCVNVHGVEPGGWAFEFANDKYPDTDDTAEVLIALRLLDLEAERGPAFLRAERWLRAMQSRNGGWGAFDKDNTHGFVTQIPFADFGATLDPPSEDVTAHIVEALALLGRGSGDPAVARALRYLWGTQGGDGSWFGRWGVNYIYGTGAVAPALVAAGYAPHHPRLRRAARWLQAHQNADGGWGESCASYDPGAAHGVGPSTASQTAWALLALLAIEGPSSAAVERGIRYLIETQSPDGGWQEDEFTGTGFPRDFMLNYHLYRNYWPLWALGRYRRLCDGTPIHLPGTDPLA
jgi:squalene-hopene/tetraprenyl-beta-curcumene cyclase